MIQQITVFLENKKGRLHALCKTLSAGDINMSALTIADTADYGVIRIICDKPQAALDLVRENGFIAVATDVVAVSIPNKPGGLARLLEVFDRHSANIEYAYCFSTSENHAIDIVKLHDISDIELLEEELSGEGYSFLSLDDLNK